MTSLTASTSAGQLRCRTELDHGFHDVRGAGLRFTFAPEAADEILERLLELNRDRYLAEVEAGLHGKAKTKDLAPLGGLFQDPDHSDDQATG